MALQLILGGSGAGKSHCLYEKIIKEAMTHPEQQYLVLVPEQFTLQTQRELVERHPNHGILNIDVLSFQRLAYRVFEETGREIGTVLEETGKNLMLRRVAQEEQQALTILGSNLRRMGTISQMKSMISELTQYGITSEQLTEAMEQSKSNPQLYYKLQDMRLLYEQFHKSLEGRYITAEEILEVLCQVVDRSELLKGSVVALDGFTGFTPVQNRLLQKIMGLAADVLVTVTLDDKENPEGDIWEHEIFAMSKKTIKSLKKLAAEAQVPVAPAFVVPQNDKSRFHGAGPLFWLEQQLFRYGSQPFEGSQDAIRMLEARSPREEVRWAAEEICRLIRSGCRYGQIGVVAGDLTVYSHYIEEVFPDYGIPVFLDYKRSVLQNPMVEFLRAFLEMAEQDFTYESVFRYLRSGLAGMEQADVDVLENYVLALGIRGHRKWESRWIRLYGDLKEEDLARINELRVQFWEQSGEKAVCLREKDTTVLHKTRCLYELITGLKLQEQLKGRENRLNPEKEASLVREYRQIYPIIMDLLDKLAELLGDEVLPLSEYREILDAGFAEAKVGIVPPGLDQVMAGDVERTRLKDIRALFFLGVNEGNVPKAVSTPGVLSALDRERLQKLGMELAPTPRQQAYTQRMYLYLNMTKPSERLYVTYSQVDASGKALQPSYLIATLQKLFPQMVPEKARTAENGADITEILTERQALEYLKKSLADYRRGGTDYKIQTIYRWFAGQKQWEKKLRQLLDGAFAAKKESSLGKAVAHALYGAVLENSVTRLEQFASCAYAHFLRYGLNLSEREIYEFQPVDMGNIFHGVMELFFKKLEVSSYNWNTLPEQVRDEWTDACLDQLIADYGNTVLQSTARNAYAVDRMRRIIRRSIWAVGEQLKLGSFAPDHFEVSFAQVSELEAVNISLSEEEKLRLRGRIDRLDLCEEDDRVLVKVVDYKSGNTVFQLLSLYHGLQLQLVVYLGAALELEQKKHPGKEAVPAGIFYYRMQDPMLDLEEGESEEARNQRILESLKLNGLVNREDMIIQKLDRTMPGKSGILPLSYNKDGGLRSGSSVASKEQFEQVLDYTKEKIRALGSQILDGEIAVNPYELDGRTACDFCPYGGVCQRDAKGKNFGYRKLPHLSEDEIWSRLAEPKEKKEE